MNPEPAFRADLYQGTAAYYDRYRPGYPQSLFDDLRGRLPLTGGGRLLDLACGTGQVALPLARDFAEVVAVDQEPGAVTWGRRKAQAAGLTHVRWITGAAETVAVDGRFELVSIGNAFHRLQRRRVARRLLDWLQPGGGVALLWADTPAQGKQRWQQELAAVFEEWLTKAGTRELIPAGWQETMATEPPETVLRDAGLTYLGRFKFTATQTWTVESLIGFAYSTSILSRRALGDASATFERELAERLSPLATDGTFAASAGYAYELACTAGPTPAAREQ